ncbi:HAD family hydrolase [Flagellimonas sp.]|uniref:HAD family hydrolase n=1 Tax=Flagellimonas sp. TaxID=2058762 RepID=UPI003B505990
MHKNGLLGDYKNIIWDWNGTLLNDSWLCIEIINKILLNHGNRKLDIDSYREVFGFPISDYYKKIGIDCEKESYDVLTDEFMSDYLRRVCKCQLQNGAKDILEELKSMGVTQFILTAAHKESVIELLRHHSVEHMFEWVEGLDNHRAESKIDNGYNLINENSIEINETVLIGDTIHDFEVANQIGTNCILIANGHQSKLKLRRETRGSVEILDDLYELIR